MSADTKIITISVQMNVALSVNAYRDENGDVQIESVRQFVGLPCVRDIYETMGSEQFAELDAAFEEVP